MYRLTAEQLVSEQEDEDGSEDRNAVVRWLLKAQNDLVPDVQQGLLA